EDPTQRLRAQGVLADAPVHQQEGHDEGLDGEAALGQGAVAQMSFGGQTPSIPADEGVTYVGIFHTPATTSPAPGEGVSDRMSGDMTATATPQAAAPSRHLPDAH